MSIAGCPLGHQEPQNNLSPSEGEKDGINCRPQKTSVSWKMHVVKQRVVDCSVVCEAELALLWGEYPGCHF